MARVINFDTNESFSDLRIVGPTSVTVSGTFGGGTLSILAAPIASDGTAGTYVEIKSLTAANVFNDTIIGPHMIKGTLTGATSPNLNMIFA